MDLCANVLILHSVKLLFSQHQKMAYGCADPGRGCSYAHLRLRLHEEGFFLSGLPPTCRNQSGSPPPPPPPRSKSPLFPFMDRGLQRYACHARGSMRSSGCVNKLRTARQGPDQPNFSAATPVLACRLYLPESITLLERHEQPELAASLRSQSPCWSAGASNSCFWVQWRPRIPGHPHSRLHLLRPRAQLVRW